jgi:hypothetical protein
VWDRKLLTTLHDLAAACSVAVSDAQPQAQRSDAACTTRFPNARLYYVSGHSVPRPTPSMEGSAPIPKLLCEFCARPRAASMVRHGPAPPKVKNIDFIRDHTHLVVSADGVDFERVRLFCSPP